jgi:hypothetical protein
MRVIFDARVVNTKLIYSKEFECDCRHILQINCIKFYKFQ